MRRPEGSRRARIQVMVRRVGVSVGAGAFGIGWALNGVAHAQVKPATSQPAELAATMLRGHVEASGATRVTVLVLPPNDALIAMDLGESLPLRQVAAGTVDGAGNYTAAPEKGLELASLVGPGADDIAAANRSPGRDGLGSFDVKVVASDASGRTLNASMATVLPVRSDRGAVVLRSPNERPESAKDRRAAAWTSEAPFDLDLAGSPRPADGSIAPTHSTETEVVRGDKQWVGAAEYRTTLWSDHPNQVTAVGEVNNAGPGDSHFGYDAAATTTVGVGFSLGGAYSANGSKTITSGVSLNFGTHGSGAYILFQTNMHYRKYKIEKRTCTYSPVGTCMTWSAWTTDHWDFLPVYLDGGTNLVSKSSEDFTTCNSYAAGTGFIRTSSAAVTYSNGIAASASAIGINLSAQTGFTSKASIGYSFPAAGKMCGSNASAGTAHRIMSKKA